MAISIRLPKDIEDRLNQLSALTGRSKAYYVTAAIQEHLDDIEDYYTAEKRDQDVQTGRSKTIPLTDVMKRFGLDD